MSSPSKKRLLIVQVCTFLGFLCVGLTNGEGRLLKIFSFRSRKIILNYVLLAGEKEVPKYFSANYSVERKLIANKILISIAKNFI